MEITSYMPGATSPEYSRIDYDKNMFNIYRINATEESGNVDDFWADVVGDWVDVLQPHFGFDLRKRYVFNGITMGFAVYTPQLNDLIDYIPCHSSHNAANPIPNISFIGTKVKYIQTGAPAYEYAHVLDGIYMAYDPVLGANHLYTSSPFDLRTVANGGIYYHRTSRIYINKKKYPDSENILLPYVEDREFDSYIFYLLLVEMHSKMGITLKPAAADPEPVENKETKESKNEKRKSKKTK
jgi:hypothetical protein